ncbi:MAG: MotA/TolQ/ExbB proton channel family protein [Cyclobacteriaceae bacterium]
MRKFVITLSFLGLGLFAQPQLSMSQETATEQVDTTAKETPDSATMEAAAPVKEVATEAVQKEKVKITVFQHIKQKFVEGGVMFMSLVLICLIIGLAIAIERVIILNLSSTNVSSLLASMKDALSSGGTAAAQQLAARTKGPVASIFSQGLLRSGEGIENVEKSIISYGSVEMGKLEKGLSWISLFIAIAPLLGFMGTVIGMIDAFDSIMNADGIEISEVAGGIKTALLTTVAGLIVAIILQVFYNYCVSKIDSIVNQMEDASISFVDTLIAHEAIKK